VASQGEDATTGTTDVAEQGLNDASGPDHLHAGCVMRPFYRIAPRAGAFPSGVTCERFCDLEESFLRAAGHALDHRRRVGRIMAPENLIDAVGVLQRGIGGRRTAFEPAHFFAEGFAGQRLVLGERRRNLLSFVLPGIVFVLASVHIPARE
jgi:hypothetical protein